MGRETRHGIDDWSITEALSNWNGESNTENFGYEIRKKKRKNANNTNNNNNNDDDDDDNNNNNNNNNKNNSNNNNNNKLLAYWEGIWRNMENMMGRLLQIPV